jgi:hypothetical protein
VPTGRAAWPSRTNVRHPAAQVLTAQPFVLDGLPGPGRAGHGRWQGVDAPSARAASLASSAALPVPARRHRGRGPRPLRWTLRRPPAYPFAGRERRSRWSCPFVGPVSRKNRGRLAPLGGSGAARPQGALRAIDSSACPRSWRTCGPRRLRRQSQAGVVATQGGAAEGPQPRATRGSSVAVGSVRAPLAGLDLHRRGRRLPATGARGHHTRRPS